MLKATLLAGATWLAVSFLFCLLIARKPRVNSDSSEPAHLRRAVAQRTPTTGPRCARSRRRNGAWVDCAPV
jgi:hypothetical protein